MKQRIALRCELTPLDLRETAAYIAARVRVAGGKAEQLFTREAVSTIHEYSQGIPRTISVICDNALVNGFAADRKPVGRDLCWTCAATSSSVRRRRSAPLLSLTTMAGRSAER